MSLHIKNWDADKWISLSAMIVALCALIFSIWQGILTRNHYKILVRPLVTISGALNESGSGWKMGNSGLGPAIVKWFKVTVDGEPIKNWRDFSKVLNLPDPYTFDFHYWVPSSATVIQPQEHKNLFWVAPGPADKMLRTNKNKVVIHLCYCSLYGECWLTSAGKDTPPYQPCCELPEVKFQPHYPSN